MKSSSCLRHVVALCASLFGVLEHAVLAAPADGLSIFVATESPRIISRKEWKARERRDFEILPVTPTPYVVIHHGGIRNYCHDQESCSAIVRSYQNWHMDGQGWWDIGYNFLVGEDGNAYEGRGWDYVGAHAPGYNSQSIGICVPGLFSDFLPNSAALKTLNALIAYGVSLGKISSDYNVIGHRQARNTECPGESFYKYVTALPRWTSKPIPISTSNHTNGVTTLQRNDTPSKASNMSRT